MVPGLEVDDAACWSVGIGRWGARWGKGGGGGKRGGGGEGVRSRQISVFDVNKAIRWCGGSDAGGDGDGLIKDISVSWMTELER